MLGKITAHLHVNIFCDEILMMKLYKCIHVYFKDVMIFLCSELLILIL